MINFRSIVLASAIGSALPALAGDQPSVRIEPPAAQGPRQLQDQTAKAAIGDYIDSWQTMSRALEENRPDLLDRDFTGAAREKLAATIKDQSAAGIHAVYRDRSHDVQVLFYSPEGLSIELADTVQYEVQLFDRDKAIGNEQVRTRYIVVLTPSEIRWRVRIFQSQNQ
jgi:hypothetical protein